MWKQFRIFLRPIKFPRPAVCDSVFGRVSLFAYIHSPTKSPWICGQEFTRRIKNKEGTSSWVKRKQVCSLFTFNSFGLGMYCIIILEKYIKTSPTAKILEKGKKYFTSGIVCLSCYVHAPPYRSTKYQQRIH